MKEYVIVGRKLPSDETDTPRLYQMTIFARDEVQAKSRFWYFLKKLKKIKKTVGEIVSIKEVAEPEPLKPKNYGIWLKLVMRTGICNMYKEFREMSRADAVKACYSDLASKHMARFENVQIINIKQLADDQVKKNTIKQLLDPDLKFPLPHKFSKLSKAMTSKFI